MRYRQDHRDVQRFLLLLSLEVEEGGAEVVEGLESLCEVRHGRVVDRLP